MVRIITITIGTRQFSIHTDADDLLAAYLNRVARFYHHHQGKQEIINGVEEQLAELFNRALSATDEVITTTMVNQAISILGEPDKKETKKPLVSSLMSMPRRKLYRDADNRVLGGVCAGIAAYFSTEISYIRIGAIVLVPLTSGIAAVVYFVLWMVVEPAITPAQKIEMSGQNVTIEALEKAIRSEVEEVKRSFYKIKESSVVKRIEDKLLRLFRIRK